MFAGWGVPGTCLNDTTAICPICHELVTEAEAPRVRGRPRKLTPMVRHAIVHAAASGLVIEQAAGEARVSKRTLQRWLARGRDFIEALDITAKVPKSEQAHVDLWLDFGQASAQYDRGLMMELYMARGDHQLRLNACWLLERRKYHLFGANRKTTDEDDQRVATAPEERIEQAIKAWGGTRPTGRLT